MARKSPVFDRDPAPRALADLWKERSRSFDRFAQYQWWEVNVTGSDEPERAIGYRVDPALFSLLGGVRPALGRAPLEEEATPGRDHVVVLSWDLWQRRFAADGSLLGKPVALNGESYTVIGVMGKDFHFPEAAQLWSPLAISPAESPRSPATRSLGRLRRGLSLEDAERELAGLQREFERDHPGARLGNQPNVFSLRDYAVPTSRLVIWVLMAAVALLLLIACANVGNMLLARSTGRAREIAIRAALGASRGRIVRQLMTESTLLTIGACLLGMIFASWGIDLIHGMVPPITARYIAGWEHVGIDRRVLAFSAGTACLTVLVAGLAPALHTARLDLQQVLQRETRTASAGRERRRLRSALLLGETSLALVLAVCAGLLIRTFVHQLRMSYGFDPAQVLTMQVSLAGESYRDPAAVVRYYDEALRRLAALPGVTTAAAISFLPLGGSTGGRSFSVEGAEDPDPRLVPTALLEVVSADAFRALRIALLAGRTLEARDDARAPLVAVVSETLARRHFGSPQAALGHRLRLGEERDAPPRTVVGVVSDVRIADLRDGNRDALYLPLAQEPWRAMALVLRTAVPPLALASAARSELFALDRNQPVEEVRTMEQMLDDNMLLGPRVTTELLAFFSLLSLLLTAVGIYGVMAYSVAQRTQEIGIRLALGALPTQVLTLVIRQGLLPALLGIALGVVGALGASRALEALLIGVSPLDPITFASVPAFLFAVAVFASWVPARRATTIDPASALRVE